jgi:hypothetical protein
MKKVLVLVSVVLLSSILYSQGKTTHRSSGRVEIHNIDDVSHICSKSEKKKDKEYLKNNLSHIGGKIVKIKHVGHKQYKVIRVYSNRWVYTTFNLRRHKQ